MLSLKDSYKTYKETCSSHEKILVFKDYIDLCLMFMHYMTEVILSGYIMILPEKLGKIYILGKKQNIQKKNGILVGLAVDWKKTKALWEKSIEHKLKKTIIYITNEHTNGYIYTVFWNRFDAILRNKAMYKFSFTRKSTREIKQRLIDNTEYILK